MKLKAKPNLYDITISSKKDPMQWTTSRVEESALQIAIMGILSSSEWQLECVALTTTSKPNRFELPSQ